MCRSQADGGRRCPGGSRHSAGHAGDGGPVAHHHCYCAGSHKPDCPNYGDSTAMPPLADDDSQPESYQGTQWQGYDEAAQRGEEIHRRVYEGESITGIMSDGIVKRAQERIAQIAEEGW